MCDVCARVAERACGTIRKLTAMPAAMSFSSCLRTLYLTSQLSAGSMRVAAFQARSRQFCALNERRFQMSSICTSSHSFCFCTAASRRTMSNRRTSAAGAQPSAGPGNEDCVRGKKGLRVAAAPLGALAVSAPHNARQRHAVAARATSRTHRACSGGGEARGGRNDPVTPGVATSELAHRRGCTARRCAAAGPARRAQPEAS